MVNINKNWIWVILLVMGIILFYKYGGEIFPGGSISTFSILPGEFSAFEIPKIEKDCGEDKELDCQRTLTKLEDGSTKVETRCVCIEKRKSGIYGITDMSIYERNKQMDEEEER